MRRITKIIKLLSYFNDKGKISTALTVSGFNQLVSSGTSFAINIYLLRLLPTTEYGLYGIGFSISLFYTSIAGSLFLTQMVVHMPDKIEEERPKYATQIFFAIAIFSGLTLLFVGLILLIGEYSFLKSNEYHSFVVAITLLSISFMFKEYLIKHAYNIQCEHWALECNILILFVLSVVLSMLQYFDLNLDAVIALYLFVLPNMAGAIYGLIRSNLRFMLSDLSKAWHDFIEIVGNGLWAAKMTILASLRGQSLTFVAASLLGPVSVAYLNASRTFISPIQLIFPIVNQVVFPKMARLNKENPESLFNLFIFSTLSFLVLATIYGVILETQFEILSAWLLKDKFDLEQIYILVILFFIHTLVLCIRNTQELTLQVARRFKYLAIVHLMITSFTYVTMYVGIFYSNLTLGVKIFIVSEVVLVIILSIPLYSFHKDLKNVK